MKHQTSRLYPEDMRNNWMIIRYPTWQPRGSSLPHGRWHCLGGWNQSRIVQFASSQAIVVRQMGSVLVVAQRPCNHGYCDKKVPSDKITCEVVFGAVLLWQQTFSDNKLSLNPVYQNFSAPESNHNGGLGSLKHRRKMGLHSSGLSMCPSFTFFVDPGVIRSLEPHPFKRRYVKSDYLLKLSDSFKARKVSRRSIYISQCLQAFCSIVLPTAQRFALLDINITALTLPLLLTWHDISSVYEAAVQNYWLYRSPGFVPHVPPPGTY